LKINVQKVRDTAVILCQSMYDEAMYVDESMVVML